MRTTLTTALAAAAAIPLAFLAAAPASADPGDISAVFTTTPNPGGSNTVTGTFTVVAGNNFVTYCAMQDADAVDANGDLLLSNSANDDETPGLSLTVIDTDVPDGTYTIDWYCGLSDGGGDATTGFVGLDVYSAPTTLVVPAVVPEEPEVPEAGCTGSVCLPTGSFGF